MYALFVAHHHSLVRYAVVDLLESSGVARVVGSACSVGEVLPALAEAEPDCLLLELTLPNGSPLQLIREARVRFPGLRIIVANVSADAEVVARALRAGAVGYIGNRNATDELVEAIPAVAEGNSFVGEELSEELALRGVLGDSSEPLSSLSDREYEVLKLLGSGTPVSRISEVLNISGSTVNTHRQRIMRKLHIASAGELMRYAIEVTISESSTN